MQQSYCSTRNKAQTQRHARRLMAPSSKYTLMLIAVLVAFAVVLQQPTSAIRAEGAPAADPEAAPPSCGGIPPLPPQPMECRPWLMRMMPCAGFITNSSVYAPEPTCCGGFNSMFAYGTVTCLCHVVNGDVGHDPRAHGGALAKEWPHVRPRRARRDACRGVQPE